MQNKYERLLYKRGYIITDSNISIDIPDWICEEVGEYYVHFDPLNETVYKEVNGKWVFILGHYIDTLNNTNDKNVISHYLLESLGLSDNDFYNYIDFLAGRYIILYFDGDRARILSDATGMKSIAYSTNDTLLSSHVELLQELTNAKLNPKIKKEWHKLYKGYYIPGHYTPYENLLFLTPNTLLEIDTKEVVRFFPREDIIQKNPEEIAKEIAGIVKRQMEIISNSNKKLYLSLTAGNDSRSTLALLKEYVDHLSFFTYYKISGKLPNGVKSLEIDREVVGEMVDNLRLHHQFLPLNQDTVDSDYREFAKMMKKNTFMAHGHLLAKFYYDKLSGNVLHIRSNILEIGRYFYRERHKLPAKVDAKSLTTCYSKLAIENNEVIELFDEYIEKVQMNNIYNYDPFDLFYWEYRMGIWHSQLLLESDVAHETFIPFNSRNILKLMLATSDETKKNNDVFKEIVNIYWPVLNYWGVNTVEKPHMKVENKSKKVLDEQIYGYGMALDKAKFNVYPKGLKKNHIVMNKSAKFYMDKTNPQQGEYVQMSVPLTGNPGERYQIILQIRSPYESTKHFDRMKYQIIVDGKQLLEEDISLWRETNLVSIHHTFHDKIAEVKIRVVANRDCESWNWGKAGTLIVERINVRKSEELIDKVICTSPFSVII